MAQRHRIKISDVKPQPLDLASLAHALLAAAQAAQTRPGKPSGENRHER